MLRLNHFFILLIISIYSLFSYGTAFAQIGIVEDLAADSTEYAVFYATDDFSVDVEDESPVVYDSLFFNMLATNLNEVAPFYMGSGMELQGVSMEDNVINFIVKCDSYFSIGIDVCDERNNGELKYKLALMLYGGFDEMGEDSCGNSIMEEMEYLGLRIQCDFYSVGLDDSVMTITLTGDEISTAGKFKQGIYSI